MGTWESACAKWELWEGAAAALVHRGWLAGMAISLTSIHTPAPGPPHPSPPGAQGKQHLGSQAPVGFTPAAELPPPGSDLA